MVKYPILMTYSLFKNELICPFTCEPYITALLFYIKMFQVRNCGRLASNKDMGDIWSQRYP